MAKNKKSGGRRTRAVRNVVRGGGIISSVINRAIDALPIELHLPGYQYCGPGTRLRERLARGDPGINQLDQACKVHDIAYSKYTDSANRARADKELATVAWKRVKAGDSSVGERAAALAVTAAMKAKGVVGGGRRRKCCKKKKSGRGLYLRPYKGAGKKKKGVAKKKKINPDKTVDESRSSTLRAYSKSSKFQRGVHERRTPAERAAPVRVGDRQSRHIRRTGYPLGVLQETR